MMVRNNTNKNNICIFSSFAMVYKLVICCIFTVLYIIPFNIYLKIVKF